MKRLLGGGVAAMLAATMMSATALAGDLVINFDDLNPGPKKRL